MILCLPRSLTYSVTLCCSPFNSPQSCGSFSLSTHIYTPESLAVKMVIMRLQKTASSFFQSRSVSGQSIYSDSPTESPTVERTEILATPEPQGPLSPNPQSRPSSRLRNGIPSSPPSDRISTSGTLNTTIVHSEKNKTRRRSWFGRSKSADSIERGSAAWIIGHSERQTYDLRRLAGGEQLQELWDESADCKVHLFPRTSGKGASFKLDSTLLASSKFLSELILPCETGKLALRTTPSKRSTNIC
jgi:hypothetical protein